MPIYEYEREDGTRFEIRQEFSSDHLETDPETGQRVRRVISSPRIIYKDTVGHFTSYVSQPKDKKKAKKAT
ncbi:MAG: zinc ribbon domain-containing protein [Actinomycetota bacterium]|nr:zinc ribbon domain-containing protein [Actinomycetota bacterium]